MDAWEGRGTPLQVSLAVTETLGTGAHGPTVSLSTNDGLSFAAQRSGDGLKDRSTVFVADLADANTAISAITLHTTADDGAVAASGIISLGACDSGACGMATSEGINVTAANGSRAGWWDRGDESSEDERVEQNISFGYRMGTLPVLKDVWPIAAPVGGGLIVEVRFQGAAAGEDVEGVL